jgi:hypothetical protein
MASIIRSNRRKLLWTAPLLAIGLTIAAWNQRSGPEVAAQVADKKAPPKSGEDRSSETGILTVTEFHRRLEDLHVHPGIEVYYCGPLARPRGVGGVDPVDRPANAVSWNVTYTKKTRSALGFVLFRLSISLDDKPGGIGVCTIRGTKLYLYVSDIRKNGTVDDKVLPDYGVDPSVANLTIRELVKKIAD